MWALRLFLNPIIQSYPNPMHKTHSSETKLFKQDKHVSLCRTEKLSNESVALPAQPPKPNETEPLPINSFNLTDRRTGLGFLHVIAGGTAFRFRLDPRTETLSLSRGKHCFHCSEWFMAKESLWLTQRGQDNNSRLFVVKRLMEHN